MFRRCGAILHFINIHYELTTGTFPSNTVWFGEETDVMVLLLTLKSTPSVYTWQKDRTKPLYALFLVVHIRCSLSYSAHTIHSVRMFWLLHVYAFAVCLLPLSMYIYIRHLSRWWKWNNRNLHVRTTSVENECWFRKIYWAPKFKQIFFFQYLFGKKTSEKFDFNQFHIIIHFIK